MKYYSPSRFKVGDLLGFVHFKKCIISGSNLIFSSKYSDSVMCAKFQMISMQYDELPNELRLQRKSPWKVYRRNAARSGKAQRPLIVLVTHLSPSEKIAKEIDISG